MDLEAVRKSYRRYAQIYDLYFGAVFQPGRKAVIQSMGCRPGDAILEVGVGTGISLSLYPGNVHVTGIDVSVEMLAKARGRKQRERMRNVELYEMDAEAMTFADDSFDKVVAMYVASVVPDPKRLVDEMRRVCRPGGELFFVNHFHSDNRIIARFEKMAAPLSKLMGFHPDFSLEDFVHDTQLDVINKTRVNLMGYWTLLRVRNNKAANADDLLARAAPQRVGAAR